MQEPYNRGKLGIITCESGRPFAEKVVAELKKIIEKEGETDSADIILTTETIFANTEIKVELEESIRNKDIYIFQDVENKTNGLSVNDNLAALEAAIDASWRADAHYITAVIPVFPYARQDGMETREGITAVRVAERLENAGATRIITLDIHNKAIAGFFREARLENLHASKNIMDHIRTTVGLEDLVISAPDLGGAKRAGYYARTLGVRLALMHKLKDYSQGGNVEEMYLLGDVKGKKVLIIDDMIDKAGTLKSAVEQHHEMGAKEIRAATSLPLLNGPAIGRIDALYNKGWLQKVYGTDAVFHGHDFKEKYPWYEEVSVAKYNAKVIYNINRSISISRLLI